MDEDEFEFDEAAQHDPAWTDWSDPERIGRQIDKLFTETLASVPREPWWDTDRIVRGTDNTVPVMPDCGRYDQQMVHYIEQVLDYFLPNESAVYDVPANRDTADRFVCYFGELFVQRVEGIWINLLSNRDPLYPDFGPSLCFEYTPKTESVTQLLLLAIEDGISAELYDYGVDYADHKGLPHEIHHERQRFLSN